MGGLNRIRIDKSYNHDENSSFYLNLSDEINLNNYLLKDKENNLYKLRRNLLGWYTFKSNSNILEIGGEIGAMSFLLADHCNKLTTLVETTKQAEIINKVIPLEKKIEIIVGDFLEILNHTDKKFDYIILTNVFYCKLFSKVLTLANKILSKDGKVIFACNNTLGIQYLSGGVIPGNENSFEQFEKDNFSYTKKDLINILMQQGIDNYTFYYPYPNACYSFEIFSDKWLPKENDLINNFTSFEKERLITFDQTSAFNLAIRNNSFSDFCNSYLLIINNTNPAIYVKYSNQRKEEFSIVTIINQINSEKNVIKQQLNSHSNHLEKMMDFFKNYRSLSKNINLCPIKEIEKGKVQFDFITGKSLSSIMSNLIENNDYNNLTNILLKIKKDVLNYNKSIKFDMTDKFFEVFKVNLNGKTYRAHPISNIDLISDNIIFQDNNGIIIDYEWIFDFPVPIEYILYRTLFFSSNFSSLTEEVKNDIIRKIGLDINDFDTFNQMETNFQNYVSSEQNKLNYYIEKNNEFNYYLNWLNPKSIYCTLSLETKNDKIISHHISSNIEISVTNICSDYIRINFSDPYCIIKLHEIKINNEDLNNFEHNADLVINDDFYFTNNPIFRIDKNINGNLFFKCEILKKNETLVAQLISLLLENSKLKNEQKKLSQNPIRSYFFKKL